MKSGRIFLTEKIDGSPVKSVSMVWKHFIQDTQPEAWAWREYEKRYHKWLRFGSNPDTEPAPVPKIMPSPSLSYFSFLIKKVICYLY